MTLDERIDAAIARIASGHSPMRIPADPTDPDLVLAECQTRLAEVERERDAALAAVAELRARLEPVVDWAAREQEAVGGVGKHEEALVEIAYAALSSTTLGAGWVSPERLREVAEKAWDESRKFNEFYAEARAAKNSIIDALLAEVKP